MLTPCLNSRVRSAFWGNACPSRAQAVRQQTKLCVRVTASLSGKGKRFPAELITVKKIMGEGSYGQVFEGALAGDEGPARVVLKRVKKRVQGAEEMGQMEHLLNVYASKAAKGSIADFVGYIEVDDEEATTRLTQGVWLMWRYQGSRTLGYYLRRRDCIDALAEDLGIQQKAVVATVFKQVLEGITALHSAGLVHRDVKPMNVIFDEDDRRFKLIDLGACADLRTGTNYVPDESILDPTYCPPEQFAGIETMTWLQYCMPTDAPHLAKHGAFAMAMSPLLWRRFKPDKFDSFSAGLCLMQLAVPKLRSSAGLLKFNAALEEADYDLTVWRTRAGLPAKETSLLDADDAAGWELAEALLRPRSIEVNEDSGTVKFVNTNKQAARLGVAQALEHRFMQQAQASSPAMAQPRAGNTRSMSKSSSRSGQSQEQSPADAQTAASSTASRGGVFGMAMGVWKKATNKLFDLEAKIANQSDAVRTQTARVEQLKGQAATGKVSVAKVQQEESVLSKMTGRLSSLTSDFNSTAQSANRLLGLFGNRGKSPAADSATAPDSEPQASTSYRLTSSSASARRSDLPPSLQKSRRSPQQTSFASDDGIESAQPPDEDAADSPRAASQSPAPDRQKAAKPKVVRRNLTSANSNRNTASSSGNLADNSTNGSSSGSGSIQPVAEGNKASNAGVSMLYAGLKFTGLALGVASDLAKAVRQDAEKMMKEMETDAAARKLGKEQASAFVDLLREAQPALTASSSLADAEAALGQDERWLVMPADRRQQIFGTYMDALVKLEDAARPKQAADFRLMLAQRNIGLEDSWLSVAPQLASLPPFLAVKSELDRQDMFQEYIADLQTAADQAAATARQEEDFWLLLETQDPPLTPQSSWPALRRKIQSDPCYTALPERRTRQLFNQFHSTLKDLQPLVQGSPQATPQKRPSSPARASAQQSRLKSILGQTSSSQAQAQLAAASPAISQLEQEVVAVEEAMAAAVQPASGSEQSGDAIEVLRQEQAQLKKEYDRMQTKLLEMEALLHKNESGLKPDGSGASAPKQEKARGMSMSANGSSSGDAHD